ncbi:hypothetical protein MMC28_002872 [Mycoblastus sanguinarius]|nr:hypothetical protein [Mycoblastus sanguinarius]
MQLYHLLLFHLSLSLTTATLLINYSAPAAISSLGTCQLEGSFLGDTIECPTNPSNNSIYIRDGSDPSGTPALHYHRDPHFRRAEVKGAGTYEADQTYYIGYEFMLGNVHEHLAIFQWKEDGETPGSRNYQDIVFNIQFTEAVPTRLALGYTNPGSSYNYLWTDSSDFSVNTTHNIALAWDTKSGGNNKLQMWLDGTQVLAKEGLNLWTGDTYPKWGIYRGEEGDHDTQGQNNIFDSWIYKVQLSDASLDEVANSSGLGKNGTKSRVRREGGEY